MRLYHKVTSVIKANLSKADQRKGLRMIALMVLNAVLDFFSIAAFVPLIAVIIDPGITSGEGTVSKVYSYFNFTSHTTFVLAITIGVLVFVLLKNAFTLWISRVKAGFAFRIRAELSSRALMQYMQCTFLEFASADFTKQIHRITNQPIVFATKILIPAGSIVSEGLVCLFILFCVGYFDYKILFLVTAILIPVFLVLAARRKQLKDLSDEISETHPGFVKSARQIVEGFVEINSYQKNRHFIEGFHDMSNRLSRAFTLEQIIQAGMLRLTELTVAVVMCALVIYSVIADLSYQQTLVLLALYAGASFRLAPSINRILHGLQQIRTNEYILDEFRVPITVAPFPDQINVPEFNDRIELKNVSFQYENGHEALQQTSLIIRKGDKIAITGPSGEGKTTFLHVLLGLLPSSGGEILLDGKAVLDKNSWKTLFGYVPQNPFIMDGTIAENIAFGIPQDKIDRNKVLKIIQDLDLETLVMKLPKGIDTRIGENGVKLSGGQRQRLAIARALYNNAEILLFDEVTNQVHGLLAAEIFKALNSAAGNLRTIVMVTHKISDPGYFDAIYNLRKGKLERYARDLA